MVDAHNPKLVDSRTGAIIEINANPFSLGRGLGCNYVIPSKVISRTHCILEKDDDCWVLIDNSTNGTYVNGKLIKATKSPPLDDKITITLDLENYSYTFHLTKIEEDGMDDISDEQLCLLADSVLNEVQVLQQNQNQDMLEMAPNHPLHDHLGMAKSQEGRVYKKPRLEEPAPHTTIINAADSSTNLEVAEPGPSTDVVTETSAEATESAKHAQSVKSALKDQAQDNFEVMENELQCAICSELFIKAVTLNCAHTFCKHCIELWKKTKMECPICRTRISSVIATLVLDNVIEKVIESSPVDVKQRRKQVLEEREILEKALPAPASVLHVRGRGNRTRRGRARRGRNARRIDVTPPSGGATVQAVIELSSDSNSEWDDSSNTDSGDNSEWRDDYENDDWYDSYYGGYGRCYSCGREGHWARGCPYR